jgi:hypothetical protein
VNTFTTQHIPCVPGDTKCVQYYTIYIQCWVNRVNNQKSVAEKLSSSYSNEVKLNRKNLTTIIIAIYFLTKKDWHSENMMRLIKLRITETF